MTLRDMVKRLYEDNINLIIDYYFTDKFEEDSVHAESPSDHADEASQKAIILAMALFNDFREYANELFGQNVKVTHWKRAQRYFGTYLPEERQVCTVESGLPGIAIHFYFRNISELLDKDVKACAIGVYWKLNKDYISDIAFIREVKWRLPDILEYKDDLLVPTLFVYEYGSTRWERFPGRPYRYY